MSEIGITLRQAEDEAERLARKMARSRGQAADAGEIGLLLHSVRAAYEAGRADTMAVIVDAYHLFLDTDDLDGFRDALTEMMPPEWWAARPGWEG